MSEAGDKIKAAMAAHGVTISAKFVPFSQSRNKAENHKSLNWTVTLSRWVILPHVEGNGENTPRDILSCDYSAGEAHCPVYKVPTMGARGVCPGDKRLLIAWECEHGKRAQLMQNCGYISGINGSTIMPEVESVMVSLLMDASVLDSGTFADWAAEMGYDEDSRKAESTYRACLDIGLKMRAGLGDSVIAALREAAQDY